MATLDGATAGRVDAEEEASLPPEDLLDLLDDDYARAILEHTDGEAVPARDLAAALDASRATVYRRLNRLEEAGLVEARMTYDADGHHRQAFHATFEAATVTLGDGLDVDVSLRSPGSAGEE